MNLRRWLTEVFFPPRCVACGRVIEGTGYGFCRVCAADLPETGEKALFSVRSVSAFYAPLYYEGAPRRAVLNMKFHGKQQYAGFLAGCMSACVEEISLYVDGVMFVPVSSKRLKSRGFDQSGELAAHVAEALGKPLLRTLEKTRHTEAQSGLDGASRRGNVLGAYDARDFPQGARLILVDDVVTTGATMGEAANTLLAAGAGQVVGLCLARSREEKGKRLKKTEK